MPGKKTVCMISCLHPLHDDRIYWKEAISLKKHGYEVIHLGVSNENYDEVSNEGIRLISLSRKDYFKNPFIDKFYRTFTFKKSIYKDLYATCSGLKADVYHLHDLQLNRIGPKLKKLGHKPKVIYDVHEPYPEIFRHLSKKGIISKIIGLILSKRAHKLQKHSTQYYDSVITTEEKVAAYFEGFYNAERISVVYNYPVFKAPVRNTAKEYDLIYLGGISSWRGIWELLDVTQKLVQNNSKIKVLCLGKVKEPYLKKEISEYISKHQLQVNFVLKDFVPFYQVPKYLSKSKIGFCLLKDNPVYHIIMPIKIFEYMAFGLPVICNTFGHPNTIITNEDCGLAVDIKKIHEVSDKIRYLLDNKDIYNQMSENGTKAIAKKYKWEESEKVLIDVYTKLLN